MYYQEILLYQTRWLAYCALEYIASRGFFVLAELGGVRDYASPYTNYMYMHVYLGLIC